MTRAEAARKLGVPETASLDEIRKAYRRLARTGHPDADGDPAAFAEITAAYTLLVELARKRPPEPEPDSGPQQERSQPKTETDEPPNTITELSKSGFVLEPGLTEAIWVGNAPVEASYRGRSYWIDPIQAIVHAVKNEIHVEVSLKWYASLAKEALRIAGFEQSGGCDIPSDSAVGPYGMSTEYNIRVKPDKPLSGGHLELKVKFLGGSHTIRTTVKEAARRMFTIRPSLVAPVQLHIRVDLPDS